MLQQQMADEAKAATTASGESAMGGGEAHVEAESDSEVEEEVDASGAGYSLAADEYEVDEIVGERRARVQGNAWRTEYEVKWRGYPGTTWEPHEHLIPPAKVPYQSTLNFP